ncbi:heat shock 70kDa protein 12A [Ciona intestinalis]
MLKHWATIPRSPKQGKVSVVPAPPGCDVTTRIVPVATGESETSTENSSDDDESLSTLYEAEEEPSTLKESGDVYDEVDDVIFGGDEFVLGCHSDPSKDDSLDDVEDLLMTPKNTSLCSVTEDTLGRTKRVSRRLPEESSFLGNYIRGKLKDMKKPNISKRQKTTLSDEPYTRDGQRSEEKARDVIRR